MSGGEKAAVIFLVLLLGLLAYGRWTGRSFHFDVLGKNAVGDTITESELRLQQSSQSPGQGGAARQSGPGSTPAQTPLAALPVNPSPFGGWQPQDPEAAAMLIG